MNKVSGITHFFTKLGLPTGSLKVFYSFEESGNAFLVSNPPGNQLFTGSISDTGAFWQSSGSGYFSNSYATIQNADLLSSNIWCAIFSYDKRSSGRAILFNSLGINSGYKIGVTDSNRLYFETTNQEPIVSMLSDSLGGKNIITVNYLPNYLTIGHYNANSSRIESESFNLPYELVQSNNWVLGQQLDGYIDFFAYFNESVSENILEKFVSGIFSQYTGQELQIYQTSTPVVTGYTLIPVISTGITGYFLSGSSGAGLDEFSDEFQNSGTLIPLTGIISSGNFLSGVTGYQIKTTTGALTDLYDTNWDYLMSLGFDKINLLSFIDEQDNLGYFYSTEQSNNFNFIAKRSSSGFSVDNYYGSGFNHPFFNGVSIEYNINTISGNFISVSGTDYLDSVIYDKQTGIREIILITGTVLPIIYNTGKNLFINGILMHSGLDFIAQPNSITLVNNSSLVTGYITTFSTSLTGATGNFDVKLTEMFFEQTSNIYLNGIRQKNQTNYIEGSRLDLCSGYKYNPYWTDQITTDNFWE